MRREDLHALGVAQQVLDKIMALHGADIEKHKRLAAARTGERDALRKQLAQARATLADYDPDWKTKAEQMRKSAEAALAALVRQQLTAQHMAGLPFSSLGARRAFLADLNARALPIQDGRLVGFDAFVKSYRAADPGAFAGAFHQPNAACRHAARRAHKVRERRKRADGAQQTF